MISTTESCVDYLLRSISSLCLRRGCTYVALKESVISKEGRLMLSNVQPLRWLEQRKRGEKELNQQPKNLRTNFHFMSVLSVLTSLSCG